MTNEELAEIRGAVTKLRNCVESLRLADGGSPHIRRLMNDVDRLQLDMDDMAGTAVHLAEVSTARRAPEDVVHIVDGSCPQMPWHDTDDEGIGGHRR